MSRIYLDSNLIINKVTGTQQEKSNAKLILYKICKTYKEIIIPQIILGESFIKIFEKSNAHGSYDYMADFYELVKTTVKDIRNHIPSLNEQVLRVAIEIKNYEDFKLDYNDAVLVAHALTDEESTTIFTTDRDIHNSPPIKDRVEDRRKEGHPLRIIESLE